MFRVQRGERPGDIQQQRQSSNAHEKASQSPDSLHRPPAQPAGEELRETEIPQRAGPHGPGRGAQPDRHTSQDLVPEQKVSADPTTYCTHGLIMTCTHMFIRESQKYSTQPERHWNISVFEKTTTNTICFPLE